MAYLPPHKRHTGTATSTPTPSPDPPTSSLFSSFRGLSLSSPRGRHRGGARQPPRNSKIFRAAGCISRWSPIPPFTHGPKDGDGEMLRLEPFHCGPIERKTGAKPLVLVASSPGQGSCDTMGSAAAAIAERFLPDLLATPERAMAGDAPKEQEVVKLSVVARVGKVLFQCQPGGSPISLDTLRESVKAGEDGTKSQPNKVFYTNLLSECLDDMERSAVERMGLEFDSSREHYHVKVFDKHRSDSTISCKCTVQEDGTLHMYKVELNPIRHLVEDISYVFKELDLRLMLCAKRILKRSDAEVESAIKSLVSSAIIDPNVKGGLRWPLGKESVGDRFSVVGVWRTNYKAFRNETLRLKWRHADRFDHRSGTGEVASEVTFRLIAMSRKLEDGDQDEKSLKEMLESVVQMVWDNALDYKIAS